MKKILLTILICISFLQAKIYVKTLNEDISTITYVCVYNAMAQEVKPINVKIEIHEDRCEIKIDVVSRGVYFVKLRVNGREKIVKMIKEKQR